MCRFTAILMVVACSFLLSKAGIRKRRDIDGREARLHQFPWHAGIIIRTPTETRMCSGALTDADGVLTAAHCVKDAVSFSIYFGGRTMEPREDDSRTRDIVNCTKYFVHPNYNAQNKHYDIALIILPSTGPVWNKGIKPGIVVDEKLEVPVGDTVIVSGWGGRNGRSKFLKYTPLIIISNEECIKTYGSKAILNSSLCAVAKPPYNTCGVESGSLMVTFREGRDDPRLFAVSSYKHKSGCDSKHPAVFVRLQSVRKWIRDHIFLHLGFYYFNTHHWGDLLNCINNNKC